MTRPRHRRERRRLQDRPAARRRARRRSVSVIPATSRGSTAQNPRGEAIDENEDDEHGNRIAHYAVIPTVYRTPAGPTPFIFSSNVATSPTVRRGGLFRTMAERVYERAGDGRAGHGRSRQRQLDDRRRRAVRMARARAASGARLPSGSRPRSVGRVAARRRATARDTVVRRRGRGSRLGAGRRLGAVVDARLPALAAVAPRRRLRAPRHARRARGERARPRRLGFGAVLLKVFPRPGAALPLSAAPMIAAACRYHRAPLCVYAGFNAHVRVRGVRSPRRLQPSPLNLVFKSLDEIRAPPSDLPARHVRVPRHGRVLMRSAR